MTQLVDNVLFVEDTASSPCELCGRVAELRPYGPNGKLICVDCGNKDPVNTHARMVESLEKMLSKAIYVVRSDGRVGRVKHLEEDFSDSDKSS